MKKGPAPSGPCRLVGARGTSTSCAAPPASRSTRRRSRRRSPDAENRPTVGCIIPAYNEAETIAGVLDSLLKQTRLPDVIHVIINNTSDESVEIAGHYAGPSQADDADRRAERRSSTSTTSGRTPTRRSAPSTTATPSSRRWTSCSASTATRRRSPTRSRPWSTRSRATTGSAASPIYPIDDSALDGLVARFLIAGQRAQFSAFNMQNLLKGRNMAVLGGQFSMFSTRALRDVLKDSHQRTPWVKDSEVEDSLLSLQIKSAGYLTKISATARAHVGGMTTLRTLDAQQVKWNYGAIDLMWPGQRGDTKGQPFHPNLRLRWFEHISMVLNTHPARVPAAARRLALHPRLRLLPWWVIPPPASIFLNFRVARSMAFANRRDYLFECCWSPPRSTCGSGWATSSAPG